MNNSLKILLTVTVLLLILWIILSPPKPLVEMLKPVDMSEPITSGEMLVNKYDCRSCHSINGEGSLFGPGLDGATKRYDSQNFTRWMKDPSYMRPGTTMPKFNLSDGEIEAIFAFLADNDQIR